MAYLALSALARNDRATSLNTDIGAGAKLVLYSGTQPATPDTAATGTVLVTLTCGSPFGTVANATITGNTVSSNTAVASGTVGYARLFKSDGTTAVIDMDVATSNATVTIASTTITANNTVSVSSITFTEA